MKGLSFHISTTQCEFLIEHCCGERPITSNHLEAATRCALISRGLLRLQTHINAVNRERGTVLTDKGREVVCIILGNYIDALMEAGLLKERPPLFVEAFQRREVAQQFL